MDRTANLLAKDGVDEAMLFDSGAPGEGIGGNHGTEVIASACVVFDLRASARDRRLDALLYLLLRGHALAKVRGSVDRYLRGRPPLYFGKQ
jgi:hypothetical protein